MSVLLIAGGSRPLPVDGDGYESILRSVCRWEASGVRPMRLYAGDWVTLAEIAGRVGRSREIARQWSLGRVGPGGFPPPLNPGSGTCFYSWAEAAPWLRGLGYRLPGEEPVLAAMNLALQVRCLAPRITGMEAVVHCVLGRRPAAPGMS